MTAYYDESADWSGIPQYMRGGIERYVMAGGPMGGFLTAIFANDFMTACGKADEANQGAIFDYARFLYNHVPAESKGSYEAIQAWIGHGGIHGLPAVRATQDAEAAAAMRGTLDTQTQSDPENHHG